jgi:ribosomal protein S18 acetylase RimI-like enzyme
LTEVCPQVEVQCPACGHVYVAVPEGEASCSACGQVYSWALVRSADDADIPAVLSLWESARSGYATTKDSIEVVERLLSVDPHSLVVAEVGGRVVGAVVAAFDGWRGHLYRLAVLPEHRRRGVGLQLVREGERRLRGRGAPKVIAPVGRGDSVAEGLWTAAGYELEATTARWQRIL